MWRNSVASALFCVAVLAALPVGAATSAPIKLAFFDFELEDVSAAASSAGVSPSDAEQMAQITEEVRRLFVQSGRYDLVDVGAADEAPAKSHTLRDCRGCDAGIALKLGAEQSFVGVVRRVSRTEHVVMFRVRDARTGAIVADANSGLRLGAVDAWRRGVVRLVKDRLLASPPPQ